MERRILLLILSLLIPAASYAADISGFVRNAQNQPVAQVEVIYICNNTPYRTTTNSYGRYRIKGLPNVTFCNVTVGGARLSPDKQINSGSGSKEVNLRI
jgi:hypothetical protein